jgi:hypothetical protein
MENVNPAEMIVDLMELKANSTMRQFSASEYEAEKQRRIHIEYQYAIISQAIALLMDKYKVKYGDIEEAIQRRSLPSELNH